MRSFAAAFFAQGAGQGQVGEGSVAAQGEWVGVWIFERRRCCRRAYQGRIFW